MSQTAAAGVRQELLPLMGVRDMCSVKARALWKAGLQSPHDLATAEEGAVSKALASCFVQQLKQRGRSGREQQQQRRRQQQVGQQQKLATESGAAAGAAAMAARAARALVRAARELVVAANRALASLAAELAEEQADEEAATGEKLNPAEEDELGVSVWAAMVAAGSGSGAPGVVVAQAGSQASEEGNPGTPPAGMSIAAAAVQRWTRGQSRVVELRTGTPVEQVERVVGAWGGQPRFALALFTAPLKQQAQQQQEDEAAGGRQQQHPQPGVDSRRQVAAGLAVCWESQGAVFVDLSQRNLSRQLVSGGTLSQALSRLLGSPGAIKVVCGCSRALPLLAAAGLKVAGPVEDPQVAAWLLAPGAAAAEVTLKALHTKFAPDCPVRVPSIAKAGVSASARAALLALAAAEPLRSLLAAKGMLEAFTQLEMPAAVAAAEVAVGGGGRLWLGALRQARSAAQATAGYAERQLQESFRLPLSLAEGACFAQILGERGSWVFFLAWGAARAAGGTHSALGLQSGQQGLCLCPASRQSL